MLSKLFIFCASFLLFVSLALAQSAPDFVFEVKESGTLIRTYPVWALKTAPWSDSFGEYYDYGLGDYVSAASQYSGSVSPSSISLQENTVQYFAVNNSSGSFRDNVGQEVRAYSKTGGSVSVTNNSTFSGQIDNGSYTTSAPPEIGGVINVSNQQVSDFPYTGSTTYNLGCVPTGGTTFTQYPGVTYYPVSSSLDSLLAYTESIYLGAGYREANVLTTFSLEGGSQAPVALIQGPLVDGNQNDNPPLGSTVSFSSLSYDADNNAGTTAGTGICQKSWTVTPPSGSSSQYTTNTISFTANRPGEWTVQLTVTDDEGEQSNTETSFTVGDAPGLCPGDGPQYPFSDSLNCLDAKSEIKIREACGNLWLKFNDPVPTRGFPLECNIHINTHSLEPSRITAVGNATFTYGLPEPYDILNAPCKFMCIFPDIIFEKGLNDYKWHRCA